MEGKPKRLTEYPAEGACCVIFAEEEEEEVEGRLGRREELIIRCRGSGVI